MSRRYWRRFAPSVMALGKPYEGIFVNDGSRDATGRRLDEVAKSWPEAKTFHFLSNHGQAAALFFGMKQAAGEILVTLDGDGQNDPADIPRLLAALEDRDMVAGVRARRQDSWLRLAMSRLANSVRSKLLGDGLRDTGCALKAFRCEVVESLHSHSDPLFIHGRAGSRREIPPLPDRSGPSTEKAWPIEIRALRLLVETVDRHDRHLLVFTAPLSTPYRVAFQLRTVVARTCCRRIFATVHGAIARARIR